MQPIVLTIAGSDSSGGAGIQADLKAIAACGGYGASVITAITAQNTVGVNAVEAIPVAMIRAQIDAQAVAKIEVIEEVALDDVTAVAERNNEFLEPARGVASHDVPQHRLAADFDHRLRLRLGLLGEACAEAAGQQNGLHVSSAGIPLGRVTPLLAAGHPGFDEPLRPSETRPHGETRGH